MFDRASTNFHASNSGRPEFRNDDRLFQCGRIFRPRYKSFFLSFFLFFSLEFSFFFFEGAFFNVRSTNGQLGRKEGNLKGITLIIVENFFLKI